MQLQQNSALFKSISYLTKSSKTQPKVITPKQRDQQNEGGINQQQLPQQRSAIDSAYITQQLQHELHSKSPHITTNLFNYQVQGQFEDKTGMQKSSVGGVAGPRFPPQKEEAKVHQILIKNNQFIPEILKIQKGSIVEWKICQQQDDDDSAEGISLYGSQGRTHVIAFENLDTESNRLKKDDCFRVRFLESGHFNYKCQIYTRMKGQVQVFDFLIPENPVQKYLFNQKQAVGGMNRKSQEQENCIFRKEKNSTELSQRLIEVLGEEEKLDENNAPFIKKEDFKHYFDTQSHKVKCEAELTSDDNMDRASEDQEEQEREEKIFLEQQRNSSKNSKGSSQKMSEQPSHKNSTGSDEIAVANHSTSNEIKVEILEKQPEELKGEEYQPQQKVVFTPFSMLFHSERADEIEKEYIEQFSVQVLDFNKPQENYLPPEVVKSEIQQTQKAQQEKPAPKALLFVRTLEPDRTGGRKQISKEYVVQSDILIQDDPIRAEQEQKIFSEQQKKEKKKNKKKEYMKKKKAKLIDISKPNEFDLFIVKQKSQGVFKKNPYYLTIMKNCNKDPNLLTEQLNYMQKIYDQANKNCVQI